MLARDACQRGPPLARRRDRDPGSGAAARATSTCPPPQLSRIPDLLDTVHRHDAPRWPGSTRQRLGIEVTENLSCSDQAASGDRDRLQRAADALGVTPRARRLRHGLLVAVATCTRCRSTSLKIAKPFIDGLTSGRRESSFVGMIVDLAKTLELEVIAEGIETSAQLAALREMNAGLGQGYFLGRPARPRRAWPEPTRSACRRSSSAPRSRTDRRRRRRRSRCGTSSCS